MSTTPTLDELKVRAHDEGLTLKDYSFAMVNELVRKYRDESSPESGFEAFYDALSLAFPVSEVKIPKFPRKTPTPEYVEGVIRLILGEEYLAQAGIPEVKSPPEPGQPGSSTSRDSHQGRQQKQRVQQSQVRLTPRVF